MDFLEISKYGNSAEDYLISMVILVVSKVGVFHLA
jgi:hypothetical protein